MTVNTYGNIIVIDIKAGESATNLTLPDGYTIKSAHVSLSNGSLATPNGTNIVNVDSKLSFPIVNGKSPNVFRVGLVDSTKSGMVKIMIDHFGARGDSDYFTKAFEPLLIKANGSEYNLIPERR